MQTLADLAPGASLTVEDVCALLGVHAVTVQRWLRSGELKGKRLSRKTGWRVTKEDLADFVERRTAQYDRTA